MTHFRILIVLFCLSVFLLSLYFSSRYNGYEIAGHPFFSDVDQYYSYLPAAFIHKDLSFQFPNKYWLISSPSGNPVPKVSMGMAILYFPWFITAQIVNKIYKKDNMGGYSKTHVKLIEWGSFFYLTISLALLFLLLIKRHTVLLSLFIILILLLGTNLFYYSYGWPPMVHLYQFFLFSIILYSTVKWFEYQKRIYLFILAFTMGLAVIVRPADIFIGLFPLFYGIVNGAALRERLRFWRVHVGKLSIAAILFFLPVFIQLLYWKIYAGNWFFFSYGSSERFFLDNPRILDFLFSFRKGWLIYTPLMIFSLVGFIFLKRVYPDFFLPVLLIVIINIYLLSSWWSWWYGGSFGNRSMVQYYALLVFPVAAFFHKIKFRFIFFVVAILFSALNLFQTRQYNRSLIHWDSMTRELYAAIFLTYEVPWNYAHLIWEPDYEGMKRNGYENGPPINHVILKSEKEANEIDFPVGFEFSLNELIQRGTGKLRTKVKVNSEDEIQDKLWIVFTIETPDSVVSYIEYPLIIKANSVNKWSTFIHNHKLPEENIAGDGKVKIYLMSKYNGARIRIKSFQCKNSA